MNDERSKWMARIAGALEDLKTDLRRGVDRASARGRREFERADRPSGGHPVAS